ncbi:hypothetical protein MRB53_001534 [Persea americana]|uniref:Uncharacterized protein n=1 Tax=Persea americana TaxID=3435 RepID=A0ACC2MS36_PERAE|nr:hypothetical protein MRB53_001534 [Persea americana]|eukprot:TRINITY_DN39491_c1_g1_i2.p1 TRINITY_DN39491_c1_g1~~TRINITY_DN39491_c1_g1_i2.p1  ORF type:complete len:149 (+),score=15.83 TRINITY_DN39491_c1_g1_i2:362-808(+)
MAHLPMQKFKKSGQRHQEKCNRFLITVTVLGSTGPLRFIVKEDDLVASVIGTALRSYALQRRYPVLGSDFNNFLLYCANAGSEALGAMKPIGSYCCRNFVLCKKQAVDNESSGKEDAPPRTAAVSRKRVGDSWKAWLNRSLKLKITAH